MSSILSSLGVKGIALLGAGLSVLALAGALLWYRGEAISAKAQAASALASLASTQAAMKAEEEQHKASLAAITADTVATQQRADLMAPVRVKIRTVTKTVACVQSPAVQTALAGLTPQVAK